MDNILYLTHNIYINMPQKTSICFNQMFIKADFCSTNTAYKTDILSRRDFRLHHLPNFKDSNICVKFHYTNTQTNTRRWLLILSD